MTGDCRDRGDGLGERTPGAPLGEHELREDHRERALQDVEDRDEQSGARAQGSECVRRPGGARADVP